MNFIETKKQEIENLRNCLFVIRRNKDNDPLNLQRYLDDELKLQTKIQECKSWCEYEIEFLGKLIKLNKPTKEKENVYYWNDKIAIKISNKIEELKQFLKWLGERKC